MQTPSEQIVSLKVLHEIYKKYGDNFIAYRKENGRSVVFALDGSLTAVEKNYDEHENFEIRHDWLRDNNSMAHLPPADKFAYILPGKVILGNQWYYANLAIDDDNNITSDCSVLSVYVLSK